MFFIMKSIFLSLLLPSVPDLALKICPTVNWSDGLINVLVVDIVSKVNDSLVGICFFEILKPSGPTRFLFYYHNTK